MGATVKISCTCCNAQWQCQTGCGIMHGDLKQVTSLFSEDMQKKIKDCIGEVMFPWFDFHYQLSYCKQCNSIESIPYLDLGDSHTKFTGKCTKCGQETELIENIENFPCPVCHKKSLIIEETGIWD